MLDLKFFEETDGAKPWICKAFADAKISGYVYFMVCDASMCLTEEVPFEVGVGDVRDAETVPLLLLRTLVQP